MKPFECLVFGGLALAFAAALIFMFRAPEADEDWEAFRVANHCRPVAASDGSNRAGWRCDDGEVHYRWRQQR